MIDPAVTCCPPKRFTPRRLLWLSRPFRELPTPFLCAISRDLPAGGDHPTRISWIESLVNGCRWPCFLANPFRRLYLKMTIFFAFPSPSAWQTTFAFGTVGVPIVVLLSEDTSSTSVSSTVAPGSTGSFSTFTMSPGETRSCFPPDRTTAYIRKPSVLPQSGLHNINDDL